MHRQIRHSRQKQRKINNLLRTLSESNISDTTIDTAFELILKALPQEYWGDVIDFEEAPEMTFLLLHQLTNRKLNLWQLNSVCAIYTELNETLNDVFYETRWDKISDEVIAKCKTIIAQEDYCTFVKSELKNLTKKDFRLPTSAAYYFKIDLWDNYYEQTKNGSNHWYQLTRATDSERLIKAIKLAEETFDLDMVLNGPVNSLGLGLRLVAQTNLDYLLEILPPFKGLGRNLVKTGLKSSWVRNRDSAKKVLEQWGET